MTPSEIADWHDGAAAWMESQEAFHRQAAATIRELEGRVAHYEKAFANAQNADAEANGLLLAKLKIATEALEYVSEYSPGRNPANVWRGTDHTRKYSTQAIARIKETK